MSDLETRPQPAAGATRVGVVGVGHFGKYHARNLAAMDGVVLAGVADASLEQAEAVARQLGCPAYSKAADLLGKVDAVCVCVPTVHHLPVAREFLSRGIATLVEKPLAFAPDDARQMVELARKHRAVLQVGHIERYNAAWQAVERLQFQPRFFEAQRFSPYPFRSLDVDVVFDIMVHDLDLALALAPGAATRVEAVGAKVLSPSADRCEARVAFASGLDAVFSASRVHHEARRTLRLWDDQRSLEADLLRRATSLYAPVPGHGFTAAGPLPNTPEDRSALLAKTFGLQVESHQAQTEPLAAELANFVHCARTGDTPRVSGEHGWAVVSLAHQICRAMAGDAVVRRRAA